MTYFAEKLKIFRTALNLSMQDLADQANVSKSMICKIERDEVQPTIDVAGRLAKALGKTLSEMLHPIQTTAVVYLPHKDQAVWEDNDHIVRRNISPVFEGLKTEWLRLKIPPNKSIVKGTPCNQLSGEKFILVIKGTLEMTIGQTIYRLHKDDSLYFDYNCEHSFYNPGKTAVECYIVINHR